jgi:putative sigma-54 modulation protein
MTIIIRSQDFTLTDAIRTHLMRRFTQALHEFDGRLSRVDVSLRDLNGPDKGGDDKSVQVHARLPGQPPVVIATASHDLYLAISIAARRTRRAIKRALRRQQHVERQERVFAMPRGALS